MQRKSLKRVNNNVLGFFGPFLFFYLMSTDLRIFLLESDPHFFSISWRFQISFGTSSSFHLGIVFLEQTRETSAYAKISAVCVLKHLIFPAQQQSLISRDQCRCGAPR